MTRRAAWNDALDPWIQALAAREPTPAGGALALVTLAGSAALAAKVIRIAGGDWPRGDVLAREFLEGADRDARAYRAAAAASESRRACLDLGLEQVGEGIRFLEGLAPWFDRLPEPLRADLAAAERLARAACRTLLVNLAVNLDAWADDEALGARVAGELAALRARLEQA
ncbi:MAG: hypothetical protein Kow0092_11080 [Deferrisomatales bacterium]